MIPYEILRFINGVYIHNILLFKRMNACIDANKEQSQRYNFIHENNHIFLLKIHKILFTFILFFVLHNIIKINVKIVD